MFRSYAMVLAVVGIGVAMHARAEQDVLHSAEKTNCGNCHVSAQPTKDDAALLQCERHKAGAEDAEQQAPDVFLLDKLSDIYVPVVFPHKLHASMMEMGQGCAVCHHYNPEGPILKCSECHGGPSNPNDLKQPGLKGAYHRQCLGCHREWTHETDCVVCHAKRKPGNEVVLPEDPSDIMGILHPNIQVPDVKVFEVKDEAMSESRFVTFHHKQHVDLFGYRCVDCHQQESCSTCHDAANKTPRIKEDPHQDCAQCHQEQLDNDCTHCHDAAVRPDGFNHGTLTGFDTSLYHGKVGCNDCHNDRAELQFTGLKAECKECHAPDFQPEGYDHAAVGTPLGFLHTDAGCVDCHTEGMGGPISCANCHDDGRSKATVEEIP